MSIGGGSENNSPPTPEIGDGSGDRTMTNSGGPIDGGMENTEGTVARTRYRRTQLIPS